MQLPSGSDLTHVGWEAGGCDASEEGGNWQEADGREGEDVAGDHAGLRHSLQGVRAVSLCNQGPGWGGQGCGGLCAVSGSRGGLIPETPATCGEGLMRPAAMRPTDSQQALAVAVLVGSVPQVMVMMTCQITSVNVAVHWCCHRSMATLCCPWEWSPPAHLCP